MTLDDPLVRAFEAASVDPREFGHRSHLYVAWCYLRALPLEEALARYCRHLRALSRALGVPDRYHATMTWAYVVLLHGLMQDPELSAADFDGLVDRYPEILRHPGGLLHRYYDSAQLDSAEARARFCLPLRQGPPW